MHRVGIYHLGVRFWGLFQCSEKRRIEAALRDRTVSLFTAQPHVFRERYQV